MSSLLVFCSVYILEIQSAFSLLHLPPPSPFPFVNKYRPTGVCIHTVCNGEAGGGGGRIRGLRQINTCRQVPLLVKKPTFRVWCLDGPCLQSYKVSRSLTIWKWPNDSFNAMNKFYKRWLPILDFPTISANFQLALVHNLRGIRHNVLRRFRPNVKYS
jgi:hypothetical protein